MGHTNLTSVFRVRHSTTPIAMFLKKNKMMTASHSLYVCHVNMSTI